MVEQPGLWELRVGMIASTDEADELMDRIASLLDPEHGPAPTHPVAWSIAQIPGRLLDEDSRAVHRALIEQPET